MDGASCSELVARTPATHSSRAKPSCSNSCTAGSSALLTRAMFRAACTDAICASAVLPAPGVPDVSGTSRPKGSVCAKADPATSPSISAAVNQPPMTATRAAASTSSGCSSNHALEASSSSLADCACSSSSSRRPPRLCLTPTIVATSSADTCWAFVSGGQSGHHAMAASVAAPCTSCTRAAKSSGSGGSFPSTPRHTTCSAHTHSAAVTSGTAWARLQPQAECSHSPA